MTTTEFIAQYWIIIAAVLALLLVIAIWMLSRRKSGTSNDQIASEWLPEDTKLDRAPDGSAEAGATAAASRGMPDVATPVPRTGLAPAEPAVAAFRGEPAPPEGKPQIAPAVGDPDDLRQIKGVGPKLVTLLGTLGITRFDQIAAWDAADIAEVDGYLGNFAGRIERDNWTDQADYLAMGDIAGFEAKYGKL